MPITPARTQRTIAVYASPKCCEQRQLRRYKGYFNVAWFLRAYSHLLADHRIVTTTETLTAIRDANSTLDKEYKDEWSVPEALPPSLESIGEGFDAQVKLAAMVASGEVERLLMFQDPDDIHQHLPEAHALIRNCSLANIGLHINAGATFWAESQVTDSAPSGVQGFGAWRSPESTRTLRKSLNPNDQTIAFIAHDNEKDKLAQFVCHYRSQFLSSSLRLTGTSGTCQRIREHLAERHTPPWEVPAIRAAGASTQSGHGPTGGDVVIARDVIEKWPLQKDGTPENQEHTVRRHGLSHAVLFFIDHRHAQPHEADIHVLLRTCLHPARGVHLILNERSALDWGEALRNGFTTTTKTGALP